MSITDALASPRGLGRRAHGQQARKDMWRASYNQGWGCPRPPPTDRESPQRSTSTSEHCPLATTPSSGLLPTSLLSALCEKQRQNSDAVKFIILKSMVGFATFPELDKHHHCLIPGHSPQSWEPCSLAEPPPPPPPSPWYPCFHLLSGMWSVQVIDFSLRSITYFICSIYVFQDITSFSPGQFMAIKLHEPLVKTNLFQFFSYCIFLIFNHVSLPLCISWSGLWEIYMFSLVFLKNLLWKKKKKQESVLRFVHTFYSSDFFIFFLYHFPLLILFSLLYILHVIN